MCGKRSGGIAGLALVMTPGLSTYGGYVLMAALVVALGLPLLLLIPQRRPPPGWCSD